MISKYSNTFSKKKQKKTKHLKTISKKSSFKNKNKNKNKTKRRPKHLKRKNKTYKRHVASKKRVGGGLVENGLDKITSLGFEMESGGLVKLYKSENMLINSALSNTDLEAGVPADNDVLMIEYGDLELKITNDEGNPESNINEYISTLNDDEHLVLNLSNYENESDVSYPIKMLTVHGEMKNKEHFSVTEWIATYETLNQCPNAIITYFFNTMKALKQHFDSFERVNNTTIYKTNEKNEYLIEYENPNEPKQHCYYLPSTNLVYLFDQNGTNTSDLYSVNFVLQMTFGCDIADIYQIMYNLLKIENINYDNKYSKTKRFLRELEEQFQFDIQEVEKSMSITKSLIDNFFKKHSIYKKDKRSLEKLEMYLFLIIYKIYNYVNNYIEMLDKQTENSPTMFKYAFTFMVRHYNAEFYLKIKEILQNMFKHENIDSLIDDLIDDNIFERHYFFYTSEYAIEKRKKMKAKLISGGSSKYATGIYEDLDDDLEEESSDYDYEDLDEDLEEEDLEDEDLEDEENPKNQIDSQKEVEQQNQEDEEDEDENEEDEDDEDDDEDDEDYGNPLISVNQYFKMFEKKMDENNPENSDYLFINDHDVKSTKFPLNEFGDKVIVEFRSTKEYIFYELIKNATSINQKRIIEDAFRIDINEKDEEKETLEKSLNMNRVNLFLKDDAGKDWMPSNNCIKPNVILPPPPPPVKTSKFTVATPYGL